MSKIIQAIENEFLATAKKLPTFGPGDTVVVQVKLKEGERVRLQSSLNVIVDSIHPSLYVKFLMV
jgi:large subunit ribosomal protein L19